MNLKDQLDALLDATAFDSSGTKVGAVRQVYVDDASGKMTFATVSTGIFSADAIVPLHGARLLDDELHVDHTRSEIRDSPRPDRTEDGLTRDQELRLLEHYGIDVPAPGRGDSDETTKPERAPAAEAAPEDTADEAPEASPTRPEAQEATPPGSGSSSGEAKAGSGSSSGEAKAGSGSSSGEPKAKAAAKPSSEKSTSPAGKSDTPGQPAPAQDS